VSKRFITYEAECYYCEAGTMFTEDLDQKTEDVETPLGTYNMVWADCTECGWGVQFYGSNAE
jgi:hypothetical protein